MKKNTLLFALCLMFLQLNAQISVSGSTGIIPDNNPTGINLTGNASSTGLITSITVDLNISHTWTGDLTVTLISPSSNSVVIVDRPGTTSLGCSDDGMIITLIDGGVGNLDVCNTVVSGSPDIITGPYNPSNPLSNFIGEDANGTWHYL